MGAELGQTNDPAALIPGNPAGINQAARELATYGDVLHVAGAGLSRIDTTEGWTGAAADAFREVFHGQPAKWVQAGDAFHQTANALNSYAVTLEWAQRVAAVAIRVWNSGAANRTKALRVLNAARSRLDDAGNTAATVVEKARDLAPPRPGFWSEVGSFFSSVGHHAEAAGADLLNDLASLGNAVIHHPGADAAFLGGAALAGLGASGDALGVALDASGVGALAGVPLNAVSTAGVVAGVGIAGAGLGTIASDAGGQDRVTIAHARGGSGWGRPRRSFSSNPGKISSDTGATPKEIKDAIHSVKNQGGWRGLGGNKNPDVVVDSVSGEVYPKLPDGSIADDSIGNIYEHLPEPGE